MDYDTMCRLCCANEGHLSAMDEFRHMTYGPLPSYDKEGNAIVVYGLRSEKETGIFVATRQDGKWKQECLSTEMWNLKDVEKQGEAIHLAVCHGDQIVVFCRENDESAFEIRSKTQVPHKNGSNCIQYVNFIDGSGGKMIAGLIERENHKAYCDGIWPVLILEEE